MLKQRRAAKIHVMVVGFNRCLSKTIGSINEMVLAPLKRESSHIRVSYVISRTNSFLRNRWSGESGQAEYDLPSAVAADDIETIEQESIDDEVEQLRQWCLIRLPPREELTIDNFLRSLWLLNHASQRIDSSADFVIHLRPDLLYLDPWGKDALSTRGFLGRRLPLTGLSTPGWGYQPNDRFAVAEKALAPNYFERIKLLRDFISTGKRFAPELFLRFAFRDLPHQAALPYRAARVRIGGQIKHERFAKKLYFSEP